MKTRMDAALNDALFIVQGPFLRFSLYFSLLAGKFGAETGSLWTASSAKILFEN